MAPLRVGRAREGVPMIAVIPNSVRDLGAARQFRDFRSMGRARRADRGARRGRRTPEKRIIEDFLLAAGHRSGYAGRKTR